MAGKKVKCPECTHLIQLPAVQAVSNEKGTIVSGQSSVEQPGEDAERALMQLLAASEFRKATQLLMNYTFYLVCLDDSDQDPKPLIADVKEGKAMLAFGSKTSLVKFSDAKLDKQQFPAARTFTAAGAKIFQWLQGDTCLLFNAESPSAILLDRDCILEIQDGLNAPWTSLGQEKK